MEIDKPLRTSAQESHGGLSPHILFASKHHMAMSSEWGTGVHSAHDTSAMAQCVTGPQVHKGQSH